MNPRVSVVVPTFERPGPISRLVLQLDAQSLPREEYEIVVVDDGSSRPIASELEGLSSRSNLRVLAIENSGPAAARDEGARSAQGEILVMLDDDMQVGPRFLEAHLGHHDAADDLVVLGRIKPDPLISRMPIFERFHARKLAELEEGFRGGRVVPRGTHLYTGNVSMRKEAYLLAGGFDRSLRRSEDRELGIRLESCGARFVFAHGDTDALHGSDHDDSAAWLRGAWNYGLYEHEIGLKHPDVREADPWSFFDEVSAWVRPLYALSALVPSAGRSGGGAALSVSELIDEAGFEVTALAGTTVAFGMNYFGGVGAASRTKRDSVLAGLARAMLGSPAWVLRKWLRLIEADHECLRAYRARYHAEAISQDALGRHLVEKVGFQMMALTRLMQVLASEGMEAPARVLSRMIRHIHGADLHWKASIAPGVLIVHGMGICLAKDAVIGPRCILFQNVTLGEGIDPVSRRVGAPRLEAGVHVGPGATIIGPVTVGAGSKVAAGALLSRSVPSGSLVEPPMSSVQPRRGSFVSAAGPVPAADRG